MEEPLFANGAERERARLFDFYGVAWAGGGRATVERDGRPVLRGRAVVVVAAVVDTSLRLRFALSALEADAPAALSAWVVIDRLARRLSPRPLSHGGFVVPDCLFAGFGLGAGRALGGLDAIRFADAATADRARRQHLAIVSETPPHRGRTASPDTLRRDRSNGRGKTGGGVVV